MEHIEIMGLHPSEALFDAPPDLVAGIYVAVTLTSWSRISTGHATAFVARWYSTADVQCSSRCNLLAEAIINRGVKIIDSGIEHGIEDTSASVSVT